MENVFLWQRATEIGIILEYFQQYCTADTGIDTYHVCMHNVMHNLCNFFSSDM